MSVADVAARIEGARAQLDIALDAALPEALVKRLVRVRLRAWVGGLDPRVGAGREPGPLLLQSQRLGRSDRGDVVLAGRGAYGRRGLSTTPRLQRELLRHDARFDLDPHLWARDARAPP